MRGWTIGVALVVGAAHISARYRGARGRRRAEGDPDRAARGGRRRREPVPVAGAYRWLVVAGLVASLGGDLWLLFPRGFLPGLASFLCAHFLYIGAFAPGAEWSARAAFLLVPFALLAAAMLAYLWPHLGAYRPPVVVYVAAITTMGWCAMVRAGMAAEPSGALALAGALLFMTSDGFLARDRFVGRFAAADAAVMTTYYAAQALIALSVRA
jgi:uncharacterized membrane protein YhhN